MLTLPKGKGPRISFTIDSAVSVQLFNVSHNRSICVLVLKPFQLFALITVCRLITLSLSRDFLFVTLLSLI